MLATWSAFAFVDVFAFPLWIGRLAYFMLLPNSMPDPEAVESAEAPSPPNSQGSKQAVRPSTTGPRPAPPARIRLDKSTALWRSLERAFDPVHDRVLWEASLVADGGVAPSMVAFEAGAETAGGSNGGDSCAAFLSRVGEKSGLAAALGVAAARHSLNRSHWIVAVVRASSLLGGLSHSVIEQLQSVRSRFLIIAVDAGDGPASTMHESTRPRRQGQFDRLDSRWLAELGMAYHGPVHGGDARGLDDELQRIREAEAPALVHVAVDASDRPAAEIDRARGRQARGSAPGRRPAAAGAPYLEAVSDELATLARCDPRIVALVDDALESRFAFRISHPERCQALARADRGALTHARGLALGGCRPFLVFGPDYLANSLDALGEELCSPGLPVTLILEPDPAGGASGETSSSLRVCSDLARLGLLPATALLVPRNAAELTRMLQWSLEYPGPAAIRLPVSTEAESVPREFGEPIELGRSEILADGLDVAILAVGAQVTTALRAAERLSEQGVSAGVINARFLRPLDTELLKRLARELLGIVTLDDEEPQGGLGMAVLEFLAREGLPTPVLVSSPRPDVGRPGEHPAGEATVQHVVRQAVDLVDRVSAPGPANRTSRERGASVRSPASKKSAIDQLGFSADALRHEQQLVASRTLSPEVEEWYAIYAQAGERKRFLWQWCEQGAELTTLPCVTSGLFADVCRTKVLSIMLCVLLDDVADQRGRERFLEVLLRIVDDQPAGDLKGLTDDERSYAEITRRLSDTYHARVRGYPCCDVYADLLRYDQFQYFNTMRYSQLLNRNLWLLNPVEHDLYLPHAMDMMSFATIDLMCTPDFPLGELGRLREALWYLQCMGRVGNLLSTWRREIFQRDFTSGVFARAVARGDLAVDQLRADNSQEIEAAILEGGHERYFIRRWQFFRRCYLAAIRSIRSVDMLKLLEGNERFFMMHLGSRGLI